MADYLSTVHPTKRNKGGKKKRASISVHRLIWEKNMGPIPTGKIIHHKDGDKFNNSLENLQLLSYSDHTKLHNRNHDYIKIMKKVRAGHKKEKMPGFWKNSDEKK